MFPLFTRYLNGSFALLICSHSLADDQGLSLARAQQLAVARSYQLQGQDASIYASREMAISAGQRPDPVLKLGIDNLPLSGADRYSLSADGMTMRRIGLMQELTRTDKLRQRREKFDIEAERKKAEKSLMIATIQRDSAIAWLERYFAEQKIALIEQQIAQAQLETNANETSYRSARISQADLLTSQAELLMLKDKQLEAKQSLNKAKLQLTRWTGIEANALNADTSTHEFISGKQININADIRNHPQIDMLDKQTTLAQIDTSLERSNEQSDWSIEVNFQQRGSAYGNMISFGVSVPVQWDRAQRQNRDLNAKLAMAQQAQSDRDEAVRIFQSEVNAVQIDLEQTRLRLQGYQDKLLPLAEQRNAAVMAAYRGGKASLADVFNAKRYELELRLQELDLKANCAKLIAKLHFFHSSTTQTSASIKEAP